MLTFVLAAVVALVVVLEARPWEKPKPVVYWIEITGEVTAFRAGFRAAGQAARDFEDHLARVNATFSEPPPDISTLVDISTLCDPEPVWYPTHPEEFHS